LPQEARASVLDAYPENKYVREAAKSVILQRTITRLTHMIQVVDDMFSVFRGHLNQTRLEENIIFAIVGPLVTAFTMVNLDRPKIKQSALVKSSLHTILFGNISSIIDELIFRRLHSNGFTLSERHVNLWNSVICVLILSIGIIHGIRK